MNKLPGSLKTSITLLCLLALGLSAIAGEKQIIERADELPRIAYDFNGNLLELLQDQGRLAPLFAQARAEVEQQLERFEIRDPATVRGYLNALRNFSILDGDDSSAIDYIQRIRELLEKPSDKLTSGLIMEAVLRARLAGHQAGTPPFEAAFAGNLRSALTSLPWEIVQDEIKGTNGVYQYISEALILGGIENSMQNNVDQTGQISLGEVGSLASARIMLDLVMPLSPTIVQLTREYIDANQIAKADIWAERDVDLTGMPGLTPVVIAINDSGVDPAIFLPKGQMWINPNEVADGTDTDGNGYIDDVHGIGYDLDGFRSTDDLYPLSSEQLEIYPEQLDLVKGLRDLEVAIDSPEAAQTRERMSSITREEYRGFIETLSLFGNYTHGTHVAGIAAAGNPAARILNSRITFGHEIIPDKPTIEETIRSAQSIKDIVQYFRDAGVRIVNMSWGGNQAGLEYALKANGIGDDPDHRAEIARVLFGIGYDALYDAMKAAPEILFIPAAGNSDSDVDFHKIIPSSIDLPNVLVVGAVDQAGDETSFTSYGRNIRVHASGFDVESYVPGGRRLAFSGTSMAAPNVANLAGKLLAIDPSLTPQEVISLIRLGVDVSEDGRRYLIHPRRSVAMLLARKAQAF